MPASFYERHLLPRLIDLTCGMERVGRQRGKVVPRAAGRVLEVGIGTGLNLPFYDLSRVASLVGIDPSPEMHALARRRMGRAGLEVRVLELSAERIPLPDASIDTVVMTYTLCSIPEPVSALREMRRVLAPGGRLLFCEHGLAPEEGVRRWQRRLTPYWRHVSGNCHLDRDIRALVFEAGFECPDLQTGYIPGPRPLTYNYWGEARPAA